MKIFSGEIDRCPGCGRRFKNARGLNAHQHGRFVAMGCRPVRASAASPPTGSCCERPGCDHDHYNRGEA